MKISTGLAVVIVVQITAEFIDVDFLEYHFHPNDRNERCINTHSCTIDSPQKGFNCCPRIEVMHVHSDGGCPHAHCIDSTCTQCGSNSSIRSCTSRPHKHTMDIDFTQDSSSHMSFEVNMSTPNNILILVCDCYGMSSDREPMFRKCLDLNASDPHYRIKSTLNQNGFVEVILNVTQHVSAPHQNFYASPSTVTEVLTSSTDGSAIHVTVPLKQYQRKDTDIHTNIPGILVTCIAGGLAVAVPVITLLIVKM